MTTGAKLGAKGMNLQFVEPVIIEGERVAQFQSEEIAKEIAMWQQTVIMYIVGESPSIGAITRFVGTNWNFTAKPHIYYHNDSYFMMLLTVSLSLSVLGIQILISGRRY